MLGVCPAALLPVGLPDLDQAAERVVLHVDAAVVRVDLGDGLAPRRFEQGAVDVAELVGLLISVAGAPAAGV